jgi:hypothetical protein
MKKYMGSVNQIIKSLFSHLTINDWVVICSKSGCKDQAAHTDYIPSIDMLQAQTVPINVMIALQDNTSINIWPRSHNLTNYDVIDDFTGKHLWNTLDQSQIDDIQPIHRQKILINQGDCSFRIWL